MSVLVDAEMIMNAVSYGASQYIALPLSLSKAVEKSSAGILTNGLVDCL